jgi:hypothetical protein
LLYRILGYIEVPITPLIPLIYAAMRWDPDKLELPAILETPARFAQRDGLVLLLVLPLVSFGLRGVRQGLRSPITWELIHTLLTQLQKNVFVKDAGDAKYNHRVTLFVKRPWIWAWCKWPWSGYLVPVERSGQGTRQSKTRFLCAPEKRAAQHEGVAGQTWVREKIIEVKELPDLKVPMDEATRAALIKDYARKTWVTEEWVRKRLDEDLPMARSFVGIPVEINGRVAGVVILDSRNPIPPNRNKYSSAYDLVAKLLSKMLEKGVSLDR